MSIKNKRLRHEVPLLPYKTEWDDGSNDLYIPEHKMHISVTDWYPFRFPSVTIDGMKEEEYTRNRTKRANYNRITEDWSPSYGIREFVDNFLWLYHGDRSEKGDEQPTVEA